MSWLVCTFIGIAAALLIRAAIRSIVERMTDDGRWDDDWRVIVGGASLPEHEQDLAACQPHRIAPVARILRVFHSRTIARNTASLRDSNG